MFAVPCRKVSAENVSLKINKSVTDLFDCTDEITSQQLVGPQEGTRSRIDEHGQGAVRNDQATESHCQLHLHSFPSSCHWEYNLLIEVHRKAIGTIHGPCFVVQGLLLHAVHVALEVHVVERASCRYDSISGEVFRPL